MRSISCSGLCPSLPCRCCPPSALYCACASAQSTTIKRNSEAAPGFDPTTLWPQREVRGALSTDLQTETRACATNAPYVLHTARAHPPPPPLLSLRALRSSPASSSPSSTCARSAPAAATKRQRQQADPELRPREAQRKRQRRLILSSHSPPATPR